MPLHRAKGVYRYAAEHNVSGVCKVMLLARRNKNCIALLDWVFLPSAPEYAGAFGYERLMLPGMRMMCAGCTGRVLNV